MPRKTEPAYETENGVFPKRLKEIMKERGENQTSLAKKITEQYVTIQRQTISLYMNGQSKPDTERLTAIAKVLDVSADWLLGLSDVQSMDGEVKQVCNYTGLSEDAIKNICFAREVEHEVEHDINATRTKVAFKGSFFVNKFFESPEFYKALLYVFRAVYADSMRYKPVPLLREKENKTQEEQDLISEFTGAEAMAAELFENNGKVSLEGSEAAEYFLLKAKETLGQIADDVFSLSVEELEDILSPLIPQQ